MRTDVSEMGRNNRVLYNLKGTVSLDIAFYFRVYIFKTVLSVRQLMVFKFVYFVVL